jgi:hypothetical protein
VKISAEIIFIRNLLLFVQEHNYKLNTQIIYNGRVIS